jgi:hypothetical protein
MSTVRPCPLLGVSSRPSENARAHADLTAGEVEVGPLEREAFSEPQACARQEQEERVESALLALRLGGRRCGQERGELWARFCQTSIRAHQGRAQ